MEAAMNKLLLMGFLSLGLVACDRQESPISHNPDNTGINVRDRDSASLTPGNQSETEADRTLTQKIRQALLSDSALSQNAKNIKIITINGVVTLRGPVSQPNEREIILNKVNSIHGVLRVDNQLEVTNNSNY